MSNEKNFLSRLAPMAATQFLGVFNDHCFKICSVLVAAGLSSNYSKDAAFLAILTIAFVTPFLLLANPAGYLADRFPKRHIMIFAKFAEFCIMLMGVVALLRVPQWGTWPLVLVMFLMAAQSAFFSPSFNGALPEIFNEKQLSRANGDVQLFTFLAVIFGVTVGSFLVYFFKTSLYKAGLIMSAISIVGFFTSLKIEPSPAANVKRRWSWNFFAGYLSGFRELKNNYPVFIAVLGDAFFLALGTFLQSIIIVFGKYSLHIKQELDLGILQLALALGIGLGCYFAGRVSGKKVEVGIVPFGAMIIVACLVLLALFPGTGFSFSISRVSDQIHVIYPLVLSYLILLGIGGGFFIIPLRATQQQKTDYAKRGTILANANVICFSAILISGLLMLFFAAGTSDKVIAPGLFATIQSYCLSINPVSLLLWMALITAIVTIYTFTIIPEYALRFFIVILTNTIYKLKVKGMENIPEKGPALLVSNHVSFVDGLLITACSSRVVRFVIHEDYFRHPLLYPIFKWARFIEVPSPGKIGKTKEIFEKTQEALRNGDIVCVFPEGRLTRNGLIGEFRGGIKHMLPENIDVPVIPVWLGRIWGSIFSHYYGDIKFRIPRQLPYPASISIGKPISSNTEPHEIRQAICNLACEMEMEPRPGELPLHTQFAINTKWHPFTKNVKEATGNEISNLMLYVRGILLSREIRKMAKGDSHVAILLPNTIAATVSILGTLMADKVPAMFNFSAPNTFDEIINKTGIRVILTSRLFIKKANLPERAEMVFLEDVAKQVPKYKRILAMLAALIIPAKDLLSLISPETYRDVSGTGVLLFTSGSSGSPKGVMLSHHNINSNVHSFLDVINYQKTDKIVGNLPLFHSFGFNVCFWVPLMCGAKVVYLVNPLDSALLGETIYKDKMTIMVAAPTFLQAYMRRCQAEQFSSLRLIVTGAEKLRDDVAESFFKLTGTVVNEGYGCTELSPAVSVNLPRSIFDYGKKIGRPGSIGGAMPGICSKIVNPETMETLPPKEEGLLMIKGPNVMKGYYLEPEKTAEVIVDGWYNTGDMAKMDPDGCIYIEGRLSRFSKIGGEMVPHQMVEKEINEIVQSEDLAIAVTGIQDKSKGEKLVVLHTKLEITAEEIVGKLKEKNLPNLWMPRAKNFFEIESIPLLGSGKMDLRQIQQIAEDMDKQGGFLKKTITTIVDKIKGK